MKSINDDPRDKQGQNKGNDSLTSSDADSEQLSDEERRHRARNYKSGEDDIEGPNYDEYSEGEDGDTSLNAGIFK